MVFPEPTLPITLTNWPRGISIFGIYKFSTTAELEFEPDDILSLSWSVRRLWLRLASDSDIIFFFPFFFFFPLFFFLGGSSSPWALTGTFFFFFLISVCCELSPFFYYFFGGPPFLGFNFSPYLKWFLTYSFSHWNKQSLSSISPTCNS